VRNRERSKSFILRTAGRCKVRSGKGCKSTWAAPEPPVEDGESAGGASCRRRNRERLAAKAQARGRRQGRFKQEGANGASRRRNQAGAEPGRTGRVEGDALNGSRLTSEGEGRQTVRRSWRLERIPWQPWDPGNTPAVQAADEVPGNRGKAGYPLDAERRRSRRRARRRFAVDESGEEIGAGKHSVEGRTLSKAEDSSSSHSRMVFVSEELQSARESARGRKASGAFEFCGKAALSGEAVSVFRRLPERTAAHWEGAESASLLKCATGLADSLAMCS
jgi:hypothetical protein